jgi:hypothetical protein
MKVIAIAKERDFITVFDGTTDDKLVSKRNILLLVFELW